MKNFTRQISVLDVQSAVEAFYAEAKVATGKGLPRPRFAGFELHDGPRKMIAQAILLLEDGDLKEALTIAKDATMRLRAAQRIVAERSLDDLDDQISHLVVERDLKERVLGLRQVFLASLRLGQYFTPADLETMSRNYWALVDGITAVDQEQTARVAKRDEERHVTKQAKKATRLAEQLAARRVAAEAEEARVATRNRGFRVSIAHTLADQLAAL